MLYLAILFLMFAVDRSVVMNSGASASSNALSVKSTPFPTVDRHLGQRIVKAVDLGKPARESIELGPSTHGAYVNGTGI
jgi:hypothetical protein